MKKDFLKRLATENLANKLLSIKKNENVHSSIRCIAMLLYFVDIFIFYILTPSILIGFSYIYYHRENYLISVCSLFLFLCSCAFTYKKCRKICSSQIS